MRLTKLSVTALLIGSVVVLFAAFIVWAWWDDRLEVEYKEGGLIPKESDR
jgi:hypothetical protein